MKSMEIRRYPEENLKKGRPKASHMDSKQLFVLKAKTLERRGAFVCSVWRTSLVVVKLLDFRLFTAAPYKWKVLQVIEKGTEFPQTDG